MSQQVLSAAFSPARINVAAAAATGQRWTGKTTLTQVIIIVAGTAAVTFYDNVAGDNSGDAIGALPATTSIGQIFRFECPAYVGISATGGANTPGYVITHTPITT